MWHPYLQGPTTSTITADCDSDEGLRSREVAAAKSGLSKSAAGILRGGCVLLSAESNHVWQTDSAFAEGFFRHCPAELCTGGAGNLCVPSGHWTLSKPGLR